MFKFIFTLSQMESLSFIVPVVFMLHCFVVQAVFSLSGVCEQLPDGSGDVLQLMTHTGSHLRVHVLTQRPGQRQQLLLHSDTGTQILGAKVVILRQKGAILGKSIFYNKRLPFQNKNDWLLQQKCSKGFWISVKKFKFCEFCHFTKRKNVIWCDKVVIL